MLGLRFCARAFSSCGKRGPLLITVHGPLTIAASLVVEHRLQTRRLSSCGSRAQLLRGMWDPPRQGLEPVSPALAGRFSTTAPPGKPCWDFRSSLLSLLWILFQVDCLFPRHLFGLVGFYLAPSSAAYFSVFSFCLIYCVWGLLSAGCRVVVPLTSGVCLQWVRLVQWLV